MPRLSQGKKEKKKEKGGRAKKMQPDPNRETLGKKAMRDPTVGDRKRGVPEKKNGPRRRAGQLG